MTKRPSIAVNFKRRLDRGAKVEERFDENVTEVVFRGKPGQKNHTVDFSKFATKRPELTSAFCLFFDAEAAELAETSRNKLAATFEQFIDFLEAYEDSFGVRVFKLLDLTNTITRGYGDWLDGDKHIGSSLKLGTNTKNNRYRAFIRFIKYCQRSDATKAKISQTLGFRERWAEKRKSPPSKRSLSITDVASLRKACKSSIEDVRRLFERTAKIINSSLIRVPDLYRTTSLTSFHDHDVRLKAAAKAFEINRLSGSFRKSMKGLARSLRQPYGETGAIIEEIHFTVQTLIPFVLMIGLMTCFNEISLVTLRLSNLKRGHGILGDPRLFVVGVKARAGRHQRRSFPIDPDDPFCMDSIVATVEQYSEALRQHVSSAYIDTLLIAARKTGEEPGGFFNERNEVFGSLGMALEEYLKTHEIPDFHLNDLRTIGADVAAMMSAGDIKVQQILLDHVSIQTTQDHYQTYQAARERQENLAHLMNERERFITSGGRIDPRNAGASVGLYRAATPGIDCLDAMNSPVRGQRKGALCSAYGKCFSCPRAVLFPTPTNAGRLLQMHVRFEEARATMNGARWKLEWDEEHRALLDFWLLLIPVEMIEQARAIELPPIPSIE
ncbi:hypothetical protein E0H47_24150 [Rhizobium leguminosarum bv. viciae]|uniref:hypothetical protein n=1 Tax=Rhizobium leguminosarum TaxID=384 RepID=UPI00103A87F7|nr:hypothetical protein [Rhizobium leguminosarum]TBZ35727.1 hypothetical protein E0H47_24150 [Rhizobium leguminosarum bv. viciae]